MYAFADKEKAYTQLMKTAAPFVRCHAYWRHPIIEVRGLGKTNDSD